MRRSLQATSAALVEKTDAIQIENSALHLERAELEAEMQQQQKRFESEHRRLSSCLCELQQQLQSVGISYEQVERQSCTLTQENKYLRNAVIAMNSSTGAEQHGTTLEQEVTTAQKQVENLQRERQDLLDMLGRIVAACPQVRGFVAPLATAA